MIFFKCCFELVGVYVLLKTFFEFPCCLSIQLFCYALSVPVFCSKIFLPLSHLVVGMASRISPHPNSMFRFSILACCRSLFICDSSLSSQPSFDFLFVVFKETPIFFSLTNFVHVYIKSFNSMMSFVGIFVNNSFTFSVSDLTVLQSWFLREGHVVFFSDMILLMVSTLVFSFGSLFVFVCLQCIGHCDVMFGLKCTNSCFSPFLFSGYFCSVDILLLLLLLTHKSYSH